MSYAFPFVGRHQEQSELHTRIHAASDGAGGLVLVGGEAGTGKTSLLHAVLSSAGLVQSVTGRCPGPDETPPYGPWVEVVQRLGRDDGWETHTLPPPFGQQAGEWTAYELAGTLSYWLGQRNQPLVVIIEDIHWADSASLELIRYIAPRLQEWPVLLVATYRTDELHRSHPLWSLVPEMQRAGAARILLDRLTPADVAEVVSRAFSPELATPAVIDLVWKRTAGLALFVRELLEAASRTGKVPGPDDPLPQTLRQAMDSKLDRLTHAALAALEPAAVYGERFPFDLLVRVTALNEDQLVEALESAVSLHVITPQDSEGDWFGFAHALFREALLARLLGWRRRRWHAHIADGLARVPGADPDSITYHLARAGDPRAVEHLLAAGDRARRMGALTQAAERYEQALAMTPADHPLRAELLLKRGYALRWGDPDGAAVSCREAEACGGPPVQLWARHLQLLVAKERNEPDCLEKASALTSLQEEHLNDPEYQRLEVDLFGRQAGYPRAAASLVATLTLSGKLDEARSLQEKLSARTLPGSGSEQLTNSVVLALVSGQLAEAAELCGRASETAHRFRLYREAVVLRSNQLMIGLIGKADRPGELDAVATDLERLEEEAWQRSGYAFLHRGFSLTGVYRFFRGDWQAAYYHVVEGARARSIYSGTLSWYAGRILLRAGAPEEARPFIEPLPPQRPTGPVAVNNNLMVLIHTLRAEFHLALGETEPARIWLEAAERWPALPSAPYFRANVQLGWAALHRHEGRLDEAWSTAHQSLDSARMASSTTVMIDAHRFLGELAAQRGEAVVAGEHFQAALDLAERARFPFETALTRMTRGRALPQDPRAQADLREACSFFEQIGATPTLQIAQRALHDLGSPVDEPVAAPAASLEELPDGLTSREAEVVAQVAAGLTNREIAQRLVISPKTVDRHLANIFNKTGVANRAALASYAARHGLAD